VLVFSKTDSFTDLIARHCISSGMMITHQPYKVQFKVAFNIRFLPFLCLQNMDLPKGITFNLNKTQICSQDYRVSQKSNYPKVLNNILAYAKPF